MKTLLILFTLLSVHVSFGQKLVTREAYLKFHGETSLEDITASTKQASAVLDTESGALVFQVLVKSFVFEKALMQEHFNENYVESDDYPKCTFQGKFDDWDKMDANKDGKYTGTVSGIMNLHGQDQPVNAKVTMVVDGKNISIESMFYMVPEDYKIEIPSAVRDKIADKFEVSVKAEFKVK